MSFVIVDAPQLRRITSVALYAVAEAALLVILIVEYTQMKKNKDKGWNIIVLVLFVLSLASKFWQLNCCAVIGYGISDAKDLEKSLH